MTRRAPRGAEAGGGRYVLENDIPLDYQYYLENQVRRAAAAAATRSGQPSDDRRRAQLSKPLLRLFEPLMKGAERARRPAPASADVRAQIRRRC